MRVYLFYCVFFICSCKQQNKSLSIDSNAKRNLQDQLIRITKAFVSNDYGMLTEFTYSAILEKAGGREKTIALIKKIYRI